MADPVTLAAGGAVIGAALKPNNPLQGALLGATAGYTGGTALGIGSTAGGASAAGSGLAGANTALGGSTAANTALGAQTTGLGAGTSIAPAGSMGLGQGLTVTPNAFASASNVSSVANAANAAQAASPSLTTAPEWFGVGNINKASMGLQAPASAGTSLAPTAAAPYGYAPSFTERLGMAGKSAYENPMMTASALNATQGLLTPEQQIASAPAVPVTARNKLGAYDPMASMDPYKQSVVGGQPISLI